jgi:nitrate reductase delta subunit
MNLLEFLAEALRYPAPGRDRELRESVGRLDGPDAHAQLDGLDAGAARSALETFIAQVERLDLGAWEELYTRTFDLNPPSAPYLGYQAWGDKYQRGQFLAELSRHQRDAGVDLEGELSDHLVPVLRYLAAVPEPLPRLLQILTPAVQKMRCGVESLDAGSPYLPLLDAVLICADGVMRTAAESVGRPESAGIQLTLSCHPDLTRRQS